MFKEHLRRGSDPVVITVPKNAGPVINRWLRRSTWCRTYPYLGAATMPKPPRRNKNFRPGSRSGSRVRGGKTIAVRDLLTKAGILSSAIAQHAVKQRSWLELLGLALPQNLSTHVTAASVQHGTLTVMADSPVWAARLRYALQEVMPAICQHDASVVKLAVRVSAQ